MEPMIKLENIHQEFDGETILDNINLNIYEGEIVTIIGPSGAGKSTLIKALIGIIQYHRILSNPPIHIVRKSISWENFLNT